MSMPAETPADEMTTSSTNRGSDSTVAVGAIDFSSASALQCVVARRCSSRPIFASRSAPVQTEVTRDARAAVAPIHSSVSVSS